MSYGGSFYVRILSTKFTTFTFFFGFLKRQHETCEIISFLDGFVVKFLLETYNRDRGFGGHFVRKLYQRALSESVVSSPTVCFGCNVTLDDPNHEYFRRTIKESGLPYLDPFRTVLVSQTLNQLWIGFPFHVPRLTSGPIDFVRLYKKELSFT